MRAAVCIWSMVMILYGGVSAAQDDMAEIRAMFEVQQQHIEAQQLEINGLRSRVEELTRRLRRNDNFVSFTAVPSTTRGYNDGDRMLFDTVVTSYGGGYDAANSVFTCPVTGYYMFSVSAMADSDETVRAQIHVSGVLLIGTHSLTRDGHGSTATGIATTLCNQGQTVEVLANANDNYLYEAGERYSSFSGTLLEISA